MKRFYEILDESGKPKKDKEERGLKKTKKAFSVGDFYLNDEGEKEKVLDIKIDEAGGVTLYTKIVK